VKRRKEEEINLPVSQYISTTIVEGGAADHASSDSEKRLQLPRTGSALVFLHHLVQRVLKLSEAKRRLTHLNLASFTHNTTMSFARSTVRASAALSSASSKRPIAQKCRHFQASTWRAMSIDGQQKVHQPRPTENRHCVDALYSSCLRTSKKPILPSTTLLRKRRRGNNTLSISSRPKTLPLRRFWTLLEV